MKNDPMILTVVDFSSIILEFLPQIFVVIMGL